MPEASTSRQSIPPRRSRLAEVIDVDAIPDDNARPAQRRRMNTSGPAQVAPPVAGPSTSARQDPIVIYDSDEEVERGLFGTLSYPSHDERVFSHPRQSTPLLGVLFSRQTYDVLNVFHLIVTLRGRSDTRRRQPSSLLLSLSASRRSSADLPVAPPLPPQRHRLLRALIISPPWGSAVR